VEREMMLPSKSATVASESAQCERVDKTLPVEVSAAEILRLQKAPQP